MTAALGRDQDLEPLLRLRILAEVEHSLHSNMRSDGRSAVCSPCVQNDPPR